MVSFSCDPHYLAKSNRGIPPQIRITSNPKSRLNLPWQSIGRVAALIKIGWTKSRLIRFTHRLQSLLINFERSTQHSMRFKIILIPQTQKEKEGSEYFTINEDARQIYVYLTDPPSKVIEHAPLSICQKLTESLAKEKRLTQKSFKIPEEYSDRIFALDEEGLRYATAFYSATGIQLDEGTIHINFAEICNRSRLELMKIKVAFSLFDSALIPRAPIAAMCEAYIDAIDKDQNTNRLIAMQTAARLAMISIIAQKTGYFGIKEKCKEILIERFADTLARQCQRLETEIEITGSGLVNAFYEYFRLYAFFMDMFNFYSERWEPDKTFDLPPQSHL